MSGPWTQQCEGASPNARLPCSPFLFHSPLNHPLPLLLSAPPLPNGGSQTPKLEPQLQTMYVYACLCMCMRVCVCACVFVYVHACLCMCMRVSQQTAPACPIHECSHAPQKRSRAW